MSHSPPEPSQLRTQDSGVSSERIMIYAQFNNIVAQTCGVGILGIFRESGFEHQELKTIQHMGGCDYLIAGFTAQQPAYKKAYETLVERYGEPIFRSEKRRNRRTDRMFFFAIWDTKGKK
jgi:hypothetical protein